jgi:hypothetical protein
MQPGHTAEEEERSPLALGLGGREHEEALHLPPACLAACRTHICRQSCRKRRAVAAAALAAAGPAICSSDGHQPTTDPVVFLLHLVSYCCCLSLPSLPACFSYFAELNQIVVYNKKLT